MQWVNRTEVYHLGEPLLALGVLLSEHVLLPSAPAHDLAPPHHQKPLVQRLPDTQTEQDRISKGTEQSNDSQEPRRS